MKRNWAACAAMLLTLGTVQGLAMGQEVQVIPHNQDRPPNEAFAPEEAAKRMTVPPGFTVEVVASEPMIVNPVAMTIDERGRFWITESLEYPRKSAGPGRDRVKILEDTDGDGKMDKATVFAEGLNIPSGIAVGGGGVWVANAPDLLFMQDTDGDGKADKVETVLTGFGRDDTHELPNSLTWGPDGWLYGLNGVFNRSVVKYRGKTHDFTCALFRIHPKTREFQLFAEGTSNPWGVAFNGDGEAFLSACVIDHLWHLTETGYYHRQGGPYPPFTWKIESIVDYKHQKAAYCGITYFDSDAYPPEFRDKLMMGNIHGNCVNVDGLERNGSTYKGVKHPDFLSANDTWFMPVAEKVGPDGSLYVLDWYDRYHCYQDANRDPAGIDRLKGRLYRVRYKDTPRAKPFDLARESDDELIGRLSSGNVYYRDIAQRLLAERAAPATFAKLETIALSAQSPKKTRLHALWARTTAAPISGDLHLKLLADADPTIRAWGVRVAGNQGSVDSKVKERIVELLQDEAPEVRIQVVIASGKIAGIDAAHVLLEALSRAGDDLLTQKIVWRNLQPLLGRDPGRILGAIEGRKLGAAGESNLRGLVPRIVDALRNGTETPARAVPFVRLLADSGDVGRESLHEALRVYSRLASSSGLSKDELKAIDQTLREPLTRLSGSRDDKELALTAALVLVALKDKPAVARVKELSLDPAINEDRRLEAFGVLIESGADKALLGDLAKLVGDRSGGSVDYRAKVIGMLGRFDSEAVGTTLLSAYPGVEDALKPRIIDVLTQRPGWSQALVAAVAAKQIPTHAVNLTQVRRLLTTKDPKLAASVKSLWGTVREGRNPQRELVIDAMRRTFDQSKGDPVAGRTVFKNLCGQCHKIYGEGQEVGPDLTSNGRASYDQLLSNVFDPSLVIGEAYQATTVATTTGRVLSGLIVENTPERVVLKIQGGKTEIIPRSEVEELKVSPISLMAEDLEKQLKPQELVDLFSFLVLDKPPGDASARPLPGSPKSLLNQAK